MRPRRGDAARRSTPLDNDDPDEDEDEDMMRSTKIMAVLAMTLAGAAPTRGDGPTLRGVVLAEDGKPAAGARVWAFQSGNLQPFRRIEGMADPEGRFALAVDPGQWQVAAALGDRGLADMQPTWAQVVEAQDPDPVTIRLRPQGHLRARLVEEETGRPIVGARLVLGSGLDPTTDADGRLEVAGLSRDAHHQALVVAPGRERKLVLFEMAEGPTTELEVAVPRGGKAVGRVLDTAGRPVPTAKVEHALPYGNAVLASFQWVGVDAQGRFEVEGLPVARGASLVAWAAGYTADAQANIRPEPDGTPADVEFQITPQPEGRRLNDFAAANGTTIAAAAPQDQATRVVTGLVVDLGRRPVAATVRWPPQLRTTTDAAGRFRLAGVPDVAEGLIQVIPERADLAPEVEEIDGGDRDLVVVLPPGRTASGVVRGDRGAPLAGVKVVPVVKEVEFHLDERATRTDAAGRFVLAGLPDAPAYAELSGDGLIHANIATLDFAAENAATMTAIGAILGRVVDPAGRPVRTFRVLLNPPRGAKPGDPSRWGLTGSGGIGLTFTSDDGRFAAHLSPGSVHRVTILAPGFGEATIDRVVAAPRDHWDGDRPVVFRLGPPRTLRVQVAAAATGRPIPDARVALEYEPIPVPDYAWDGAVNAPSESIWAQTDARGIATFDPLSLAEARVLVQVAGYARHHVVWQDGAADVRIPLEPEAVVEGAVLAGESGRALEGVFVSLLSPENGQLDVTPRSDAGGRFRFGEVPAGAYSLQVHTAGGLIHQEAITLRTGEHATRVLKLAIPPPNAPNNANPAAPPR